MIYLGNISQSGLISFSRTEPKYSFKFSGVVLPQLAAKEKPAMHVVGDVGGRIAIMVDDMLGKSANYIILYQTNNENTH